MAKQVINVGTADLAGDGDALRQAFIKVNSNFTELYVDDAQDITLASFSVGAEGTASGDGAIAYNNATGVFTYTPAVIPATLLNLGISDGTSGQILSTDGSGNFSFIAEGTGSGFSEIVQDTTPQLGGNLDGNSKNITNLGTINTHTIPAGTGTLALTSDITTQVNSVIDSAPGAMDTLNELAAAMGDDANFSTTITNSIATKFPLAGGTMTGALNMGSNNITTTGKILFSNMYSTEGDLPSATTYHGMFAHVHATGAGYFAHGGNWVRLANQSELGGGGGSTWASITDINNISGPSKIAIGQFAGTSQGNNAIAIGKEAGQSSQQTNAVAIGLQAGESAQGSGAVAYGQYAGQTSQGGNAVALGQNAGGHQQGAGAIAIGQNAGAVSQAANSIVLNATGGTVNNTVEDVFVVKPVRNASGTHSMEYNPTTGEVTYDTLGGGGISNLVEDTTPQLGGDLDCQGFNITMNNGIISTTAGNLQLSSFNYVKMDSANNGQIEIGRSSGTGDVIIGKESNGTSVSFEGVASFDERVLLYKGAEEKYSVLTGATGTVVHDCANGKMFHHTTPAANWTANFTNLNLNQYKFSTSVGMVITQGGTAYIPNVVQIGGAAKTIIWQGNSAPTGTANGTDAVSFTIMRDGSTYIVLGQLTSFGGV